MTPQEREEFELINLKIDIFIEKYVHCKTCTFCKNELFGFRCEAPDMELSDNSGFELSDLNSNCENHTFLDPEKEKEIEALSNRLAEIIIKDFEEENELAGYNYR